MTIRLTYLLKPTNPNRLFATSGTSHGKGTNNFDYYTIPTRSIFQTVDELGLSWKNYIIDTGMQDAAWYSWTAEVRSFFTYCGHVLSSSLVACFTRLQLNLTLFLRAITNSENHRTTRLTTLCLWTSFTLMLPLAICLS